MRVLVTGGGGFIGSAVVRLLESSGHDVTIYGRSEPRERTTANFIQGDILDEGRLATLCTYDAVVHMAGLLGTALTFGHITETARVNIIGTINLLEAQKEASVFVQPNLLGKWLNPYMISKGAAERFGMMYGESCPVKYISARLTDTFGPGQSTKHGKAIPTFVTKALLNQDLPIFGAGDYEMRLLYVEDAAAVLAGIVDRWEEIPRKVDVASRQIDNQISVSSLARKIIRLTQSDSDLWFLPMRPGQPKGATGYDADLDQSRWLFEKLGITETAHEEALLKTIDWYRAEVLVNV